MKKTLYLFLVIPLLFSSCSKEQGCMDSQATNYNGDAEEDDGSCTYSIVGTWNVSEFIQDGQNIISAFPAGMQIIFGTSSINIEAGGETSSGTYILSNNNLTISIDEGTDIFNVTKLNGSEINATGVSSTNGDGTADWSSLSFKATK